MRIAFKMMESIHGSSDPIGIFDSGVGGLSVLKCIRTLLPGEDLLYIADSGHAPYGDKPQDYVASRSISLCRFLLEMKAKAIVVACNTATATCVSELRNQFQVPIIGIEPGVKPALGRTRTGIIGVLGTRRTLSSEKFKQLIGNVCSGVTVLSQACPGLVEQVEQMDLDGTITYQILEPYVTALLTKGADVIVLGCTHYPFVKPMIHKIAGPGVEIIDTGEAVAREVKRRLAEACCLGSESRTGFERFWTSGRAQDQSIIQRLWGNDVQVMQLEDR